MLTIARRPRCETRNAAAFASACDTIDSSTSFRPCSFTGITPLRLATFSCRRSRSYDKAGDESQGPDALLPFSRRLQAEFGRRRQRWPHALLMMGDQIYADSLSDAMRATLDPAHEAAGAGDEVADDQQRPLIANQIQRARIWRPLVVRMPLWGWNGGNGCLP